MLRRLTLGFLLLAAVALAAACSTNTNTPSSGGVPGVGPNFVTDTVYVTDTTTNAINIYTPNPGPSATPQYAIAGGSTSLGGPRYLAFNSTKQLYVTNYNAATKTGTIEVYNEFATGNVLAFNALGLASNTIPRGIAFLPNGHFAFALTAPGETYTSQVDVYDSSNTLVADIAGSNTNLNAPVGVAADASNNVYVGNSGNASVTVYAVPSPSPSPTGSPTASPSPSPTPSPTPTVSPSVSPSPTPTPTPFSSNLTPIITLTNGLTTPTGVTLDSKGNVYVADAGNQSVAPSVVIFDTPLRTGMTFSAKITSSSFVDPTDVKVDGSGNIYVVDAGTGPGSSKLLIFKPGANGPATPATTIPLLQGSATGMALSP